MCGILFAADCNFDNNHFRNALEYMKHRGPDVEPQTLQHNQFQLGHVRLKILDLESRSNQPFWSHDKRYCIVFNGEIYNFRELAKKYNIIQRTSSDTEILIELYAQIGANMLEELNGMFTMAIIDTETSSFFIARDRLGIKPLYYSKTSQGHVFGSELGAIKMLLDKVDYDPIGIRQYRKLRTFFNQHTLYSQIKMFPAGHYMVNGTLHRYWSLDSSPKPAPTDEEIRELLINAIQYRCISDVEIGSYLSGGVDSTLIAGLADKPHTWTVGFEQLNEFSWGQIAAKDFGSTHHEVLINNDQFIEQAKWMIQKRQEPLSVPNEVLLYKMTRAVKEHNTVVLSGEGADELFFGYDRIFRWAQENEWSLEGFDKHYSYGSHSDLEIIEDAIAPFKKTAHTNQAIDTVAPFFQIAHLHGLLRRVDNSTMLCSVEARVPFVDHRLVELMAGVPFSFKMEDGIVKAPLKRIFADILPQPIIDRPKVGFPVPLKEIPFGGGKNNSGMDSWLNFNLTNLGIPDEIIHAQS